MLVENLIKETVELQGFRVETVTKVSDGLEAKLLPDRRFSPRCGVCGRRASYRDTRSLRRFRHVPLWGINVHLVYAPRRVICDHCGGIHVEDMPWVSGKRQFTHALMVTLATWARVLTWQQVAGRCLSTKMSPFWGSRGLAFPLFPGRVQPYLADR